MESLQKRYSDLDNRETRWDEACEECELPKLVHTKDAICRKDPNMELDAPWDAFRRMMEPIRKGYRDNMENMQMDNNFTQGLKEQEQKDHKRKCDLCENQYASREELKEHEDDDHEQECFRCEKRYVRIKELEEHYKEEHDIKTFTCTECGKVSESLEESSEHTKECYTCNLCNH